MRKLWFMFAMMVCILASCSDGGNEDPVNPTPKPEEVKTEITIDSGIISNGLSFGVGEGEQSVSFSVNADWTLSIAETRSGTEWCTASPTSGGKGTVTIKFIVTENMGVEDRSTSATINAGTESKTFTITQKGSEDELREALMKLYLSTNGDNWKHNDNWGSDKSILEWYGVRIHGREGVYLELRDNNLVGEIKQTFPNNVNVFLDCSDNQLTSLDVSGCTALESLYCSYNQLTSLDVSDCTALESLDCSDNQLTSLDVSDCTALESLDCSDNLLVDIDISGTAMKKLSCSNNKITRMISEQYQQLESFSYDIRYEYGNHFHVDGLIYVGYKDNGIGWWYPGEPEKGSHSPD